MALFRIRVGNKGIYFKQKLCKVEIEFNQERRATVKPLSFRINNNILIYEKNTINHAVASIRSSDRSTEDN